MPTLDLAKYRLVFQPLELLAVPAYKGATFRGELGTVFCRIACACGPGAMVNQGN